MKSSLAGMRMGLARESTGRSLKDLANACRVEVNTIQKWILYGIPHSKVSRVADYFKVEDWVFLDKRLTEKDVIKIVRDPDLLNRYRPKDKIQKHGPIHLITFRGSYQDTLKPNRSKDTYTPLHRTLVQGQGKGKIFHSPIFHINSSSIQIVIKVWGMHGYSQTHGVITDMGEIKLPAGMRTPAPAFVVTTPRNYKKDSEAFVQKEIITRPFDGNYSLSVISSYDFEVEVYAVN